METRANFALIGLFTLAVILSAFGFIYWYKTFGQETAHKEYAIHFNGSVSGLLTGAAVQFNGIKVGEVTQLSLNPDNPDQVFARIVINANTPVKTDTKASLEFGGITGVAWVALQGGSAGAPLLPPGGVLSANGSELQSLLQKAQKLAAKADKVLDQVDSALTGANALLKDTSPGIESSVTNIQKLTGTLADKEGNFQQVLASIEPGKVKNIMRNADEAMAKVNNLLGDGSGKNMITDISEAARSIKKLAESLNKFANTGLRQYEGLAIDGRRTLQNVDSAVKQIQRDPQSIIFGPKPALPEYSGH
ncbi:MlaD family protein [Rhodoblastus sp.]|uniref:MlaD family protein n=1 Tax=Rhodoblastus sp. TaxID=1962975 RepID=UPI0026253F04|nr:MlaD family protein [Rhodoblastus sp.]